MDSHKMTPFAFWSLLAGLGVMLAVSAAMRRDWFSLVMSIVGVIPAAGYAIDAASHV